MPAICRLVDNLARPVRVGNDGDPVPSKSVRSATKEPSPETPGAFLGVGSG